MFVKATTQYAKIGFKSQKTAKESCNSLGVVLTLLFDSEQTFRYRDYYIYLPCLNPAASTQEESSNRSQLALGNEYLENSEQLQHIRSKLTLVLVEVAENNLVFTFKTPEQCVKPVQI